MKKNVLVLLLAMVVTISNVPVSAADLEKSDKGIVTETEDAQTEENMTETSETESATEETEMEEAQTEENTTETSEPETESATETEETQTEENTAEETGTETESATETEETQTEENTTEDNETETEEVETAEIMQRASNAISVSGADELNNKLSDAKKNATASNPYVITLKSGSYNMKDGFTVPGYVTVNTEKGVTINIGSDITVNGNVTLNLSGATINYTGSSSKYAFYVKPDSKNVTISDGVLTGGGLYVKESTDVTISGMTIKNYEENAIYSVNSSFKNIKDVKAVGGTAGIALNNSTAGSITSCTVADVSSAGIRINDKKSKVTNLTKNKVTGKVNDSSLKVNGIYINSGANVTNLTENSVENCYIDIYVSGSKVGKITNNTVKTAGLHAIYAAKAGAITGDITENTIDTFVESGIQIYDGSSVGGNISKNTITNGSGTAILITGPKNVKSGSHAGDISENTITNCTGDGIGIYHASYCGAIINNVLDTIGGNHNGGDGDYGIILDSMMKADTYCTKIAGNTIRNITYAGIAIYSGPAESTSTIYQDTAFVKGNIENNKLENCGSYKPSAGWKDEIAAGGKQGCLSAIYVDTHGRVKGDICNNTVTKTGEHGIYIHLCSFVNNIYGNTVSDVNETGIEVYHSTVLGDIYENTILNSGTNGIAAGESGVVKGEVRNNTITKTGLCGVYLDKSQMNVVKSNQISGVKKHGIYVADKSSLKNAVSNKITMDNQKDGYGVKVGSDCKINSIQKNKIQGKMVYGVRIDGVANNVQIISNTMVCKNSSKKEFSPIRVTGTKKYTIQIKKNTVTGNKTNYGIRIMSGKAEIIGNTVKGTTYPVYVEKTDCKVTVKDNVLSGNTKNFVKTKNKKVAVSAVKLSSVKNVSGKKAKISWKKKSDYSNYDIYQSTSSKSGYKKKQSCKGKEYTIGKLKKGTTYYYKVRGYAKDGKVVVYSDWSNVKSVKIKK